MGWFCLSLVCGFLWFCTAVRGIAAAGRGGNAFWKKARQKLLHSTAFAEVWIIVGWFWGLGFICFSLFYLQGVWGIF